MFIHYSRDIFTVTLSELPFITLPVSRDLDLIA